MIDKSKLDVGEKAIASLIECRKFDEIKVAIISFLSVVDDVRDEYNGILVWELCHKLAQSLDAWTEQYHPLLAYQN